MLESNVEPFTQQMHTTPALKEMKMAIFFVAGSFSGTANFGTCKLISMENEDGFIANPLDESNGKVQLNVEAFAQGIYQVVVSGGVKVVSGKVVFRR